MRRDTWDNTRKAWFGSDYPFTIGLMVFQFIGLILLVSSPEVMGLFTLQVPPQMLHVWRYFTYSVMPGGGIGTGLFFNYLFTAGLTYWFCGSLERSWGTRTFVIFYAVLSVVSAVALIPGGYIVGAMASRMAGQAGAAEFFGAIGVPVYSRMPIYASAVAWGILNADEMITVFFIPMRGIFISLIAVLVLAFDYAQITPILLPFALFGCGFAYLWVRHERWSPSALSYGYSSPQEKRPKLRLVPNKPKTQRPMDDRFTWRDLNPFERLARKKREKQLEKLLGDD